MSFLCTESPELALFAPQRRLACSLDLISSQHTQKPNRSLHRTPEPIALSAGQTLRLACDTSLPATSSCLPISYPSLTHAGLQPGRHIFVGQYLFTGEGGRTHVDFVAIV